MECIVVVRDNNNSATDIWDNSSALSLWGKRNSSDDDDDDGGRLFGAMPTESPQQRLYSSIEEFLYTKVILVVCLFGIIGNLLNLLVLTRKSLSTHMDRMEKAAHMGLVALAVSDLLFCVTAFPHTLQDRDAFDYDSAGFWLLYEVYGNAVINIFIMSSTWLTVGMAVSRYLAICYPIKGRELLGATFSQIAIVLVFVFCVLFNLPRFFMLRIDYVECEGGWFSYFGRPGLLQQSPSAETAYMWLYFITCIVVPLVVLFYCNLYLIRALRLSANMRREHTRRRDASADSKNIVTLTLSVIVVLYIVLVTPAEILHFTKYQVTSSPRLVASDLYNLAGAFCNTFQALNFAGNFVLYCVINVHFRKVVRQLFGCGAGQAHHHKLSHWMLKYESVTAITRDHDTLFPITSTRL